jgi:hypothetical protein
LGIGRRRYPLSRISNKVPRLRDPRTPAPGPRSPVPGLRPPSDRRDESVAATGKRFEKPRGGGAVAKRGPDLRDAEIESPLEVDKRSFGPDLLAKILPGHDITGMPDENAEHTGRLRLKPYGDALTGQRPGFGIELEQSERDPFAHVITITSSGCAPQAERDKMRERLRPERGASAFAKATARPRRSSKSVGGKPPSESERGWGPASIDK